ncbi:MAG: formylglycine-generating enzyme family protein [Planctomycetaceae bacterium]
MPILKTLPLVIIIASLSPLLADDSELFQTFVDEFVEITPGEGKFPQSFQMGSTIAGEDAEPVHKVTFDYSFSIAKYEVPQNLYQAVMGDNPSRWKGPRNSVEMMTRADAMEFCKKLTAILHQKKLIGSEEMIRLPLEAEWEYCCRAGTTTRYSFGEEAQAEGDVGNFAGNLNEYAWHTGNAAGNDPPVGALKPNPWGLYDMHGYLWEFVLDDASTGEGASANSKEEKIILRGGSWKDRFEKLTSSFRRVAKSGLKDDAVGFRCVKSTPVLVDKSGE